MSTEWSISCCRVIFFFAGFFSAFFFEPAGAVELSVVAAGGQQCDLRHSSRWGSGPIVADLRASIPEN